MSNAFLVHYNVMNIPMCSYYSYNQKFMNASLLRIPVMQTLRACEKHFCLIFCVFSPLLLMQMYSHFCKVISMSAGHCSCDFSRLNLPVICSHLNSLCLLIVHRLRLRDSVKLKYGYTDACSVRFS